MEILNTIKENCLEICQQFLKIMLNYAKLCMMHKTAETDICDFFW